MTYSATSRHLTILVRSVPAWSWEGLVALVATLTRGYDLDCTRRQADATAGRRRQPRIEAASRARQGLLRSGPSRSRRSGLDLTRRREMSIWR